MPFKLLKQIVNNIKRTAKCASCGCKFPEENIVILGTNGGMGGKYASLIALLCDHCMTTDIVTSELRDDMSNFKMGQPSQKRTGAGISTNEILDMHNFLKNWKGADIKELFNKQA